MTTDFDTTVTETAASVAFAEAAPIETTVGAVETPEELSAPEAVDPEPVATSPANVDVAASLTEETLSDEAGVTTAPAATVPTLHPSLKAKILALATHLSVAFKLEVLEDVAPAFDILAKRAGDLNKNVDAEIANLKTLYSID